MKRRNLAMMMVLVMVISVLSGCKESKDSSSSSDDNAVYGEVSKIEDNTLTIKVGTMKEIEKSSDHTGNDKKSSGGAETNETVAATDNGSDPNKTAGEDNDNQRGMKDGDRPSRLDLTGEEQEIKITDDTVITRQQFGGRGGKNMGERPEMESGQQPENGKGEHPEMPSGEQLENGSNESGEGKERTQETESITADDISEGDIVKITLDDDGNAAEITVMSMGRGNRQDFGQQGEASAQSDGVDSYSAVKEYSSDTTVEDQTFTSTGTDENAIHILNGAKVTLKDIEVTRTSSDSTGGDNSSFYGVGAAILTTEGTSYISGSDITTNGAGAAGIFAYGKGTVYASDTTINTQKDTSGGIHVAGGGTLYAWDMNVETNGESSAAIRSDRGGGKMVVDGGTYTSNGTGSPAIYSTADIAVNNATLTANGSEAICIEGLNSIHLYDSKLTGNMSDDSQNDCAWNVILYQSMSGDSEVGNSTFEMNKGKLTAKNGGIFYTTNTESTITLKDVDIKYADDSEFFLRCTGNNNQRGWGTSGQNGADCLFTAINQKMEGNIIWDSISQLDFYMTDKSTLKGAVTNDETYAGDGGDGYCNIYIEKGCTWTVTDNSIVTKLYNAGTIKDSDGKTVTIKGTDGTVYVKGSGNYTITVNSYSTKADLSGASSTTGWSDYETEKPNAFM